MPYTVGVKDSFMIAHSFHGEEFGKCMGGWVFCPFFFFFFLAGACCDPRPFLLSLLASQWGASRGNCVVGPIIKSRLPSPFRTKSGPAQAMHGATYVVDVEFTSEDLVPESNFVIDIGLALTLLHDILAPYNYSNLDEVEEFAGQNTTTEFMARGKDMGGLLRVSRCDRGAGDDAGDSHE